MIKIVSGFSLPAGSTVALVNLCNQLNERGYDCILYGPDNWHMDKCKSAKMSDFCPENGDTIVVHNINLFSVVELYKIENKFEELRKKKRLVSLKGVFVRHFPRSRKHVGIRLILSCQENELFPLRRLNYAMFDKIHYVHSSQITYHKIMHRHFVCPNFSNHLIASEHKPIRTAGVIGSIRQEYQTEVSIENALQDGMEPVILYGYLIDPVYYYEQIVPLIKKYPGKIRFAGFIDDKQKIYDSVSDVYCTVGRAWSLVKKECALTNTRYHGPDTSSIEEELMTNDQIFNVWKKELEL